MNDIQEYYLINAFADIVGIAAQNLRRLDRRGIFKPHHVDEKGCRYYSHEQITEVEKVRDKVRPRKITPPVAMRERLGYERNDISKVMGCNVCSFTNYERGLTEPSLEFIEDLAKVYELPFAEVQAAFDAVRKPSNRKTDFEHVKAEVMPNRWSDKDMPAPMLVRNKTSLTRPFVCATLDITEHSLFGYEKGLQPVTLEVVEALAIIYDVSFNDLKQAFDAMRNPHGRKLKRKFIQSGNNNNAATPVELREKSGLTREQVCEALDLFPTTFTRYENGSWPVTLEVAEDMAILYNISFNTIRKIFAPLSKMPELEDVKYIDRQSIWEKSITPPMALRQRIGFSQKQVYQAIGSGRGAFPSYEKGESEIPLDIAEDLAKLYDVSMDEIRKAFADVRKPRKRKPNFELMKVIKLKTIIQKGTQKYTQKNLMLKQGQ